MHLGDKGLAGLLVCVHSWTVCKAAALQDPGEAGCLVTNHGDGMCPLIFCVGDWTLVVTDILMTDCDICGTHMRIQHACRKLDSDKSQHTIMPLSPVTAHNSNTLLSKNVLQS